MDSLCGSTLQQQQAEAVLLFLTGAAILTDPVAVRSGTTLSALVCYGTTPPPPPKWLCCAPVKRELLGWKPSSGS